MTDMTCPHCGDRTQILDELIQGRLSCPKCGATLADFSERITPGPPAASPIATSPSGSARFARRFVPVAVLLLACGGVIALLFVWAGSKETQVRELLQTGEMTKGQTTHVVREQRTGSITSWVYYEYRVGGASYQGRFSSGFDNKKQEVDVTYLPTDPSVHRLGQFTEADADRETESWRSGLRVLSSICVGITLLICLIWLLIAG